MLTRPINRIKPQLGVASYKTYAILAPPETHFRVGTCSEAGCLAHQHGWTTRVDETTELGEQQAAYIRTLSGRAFRESKDESGLTVFDFYAGQSCFQRHMIRLDREEIYTTFRGDHRGRLGDPVIHRRPEDWVDDFAAHQTRLARGQA